jgi:tetraacyldisaccharide 4'-kinase
VVSFARSGVSDPSVAKAAVQRPPPVVSIGNLAMGGRGKTPVAVFVARLLIDAGERPAILSRGYGRRRPNDGVVIVSDGCHMLADLDRSGDGPLLMARLVPGAAVVVHEQRAMAAAVAERVTGATVHVLDDGFQHTSLRKDIDIVLVTPEDLSDRVLPFGRLRSPVSSLARAHAVILEAADDQARHALAARIGADRVFRLERRLGPVVPMEPARGWRADDRRVVAFAGIAGPERFARALRAAGWDVAELLAFGDHHRYERRDLDRIAAAVAASAASGALTTEKDAVRLMRLRPLPVPVAAVPLDVGIEPAAEFRSWLLTRLREVRA